MLAGMKEGGQATRRMSSLLKLQSRWKGIASNVCLPCLLWLRVAKSASCSRSCTELVLFKASCHLCCMPCESRTSSNPYPKCLLEFEVDLISLFLWWPQRHLGLSAKWVDKDD